MHKEFFCILCAKQIDQPDKFLCQNCQKSELYTDLSVSNKKPQSSDQCEKCTFKNQSDALNCVMCGFLFEQKIKIQEFESKIRKQKSIIKCQKCGLENDISNEYCLNCENELFQHEKKQCLICGFLVRSENFEKHYQECLFSKSLIEEEQLLSNHQLLKAQQKPELKEPLIELFRLDNVQQKKADKQTASLSGKKSKSGVIKSNYKIKLFGDEIKIKGQSNPYCYYCYKKFSSIQYSSHQKNCEKRIEWIGNFNTPNTRMTPLQIKAMIYMHTKCSKEHSDLKSQLEVRIQKLGFSLQDLENLQFYIENYAPIIIQIHVSKHMEFFLKDTHYRSQFQTNKSSGSLSRASRIQWEDRMFDKRYSLANDFERVKYGVINFTNDPKGVSCAKGYGPSYFLLKSHVRDRCTFTDKDSSGSDASISTLKFSFKVVNKMNDNELKAAFKASKALEQSSGVLITYKELQIHGPVEFAKDIERIYVSKQQIKGNKKFLDMVYEFSEKFKVQHDFI